MDPADDKPAGSEAPIRDAQATIDRELAVWRASRTIVDFGFTAIQRAVVLATVQAAAKVTGSSLLGFVADAGFLLFFASVLYSVVIARLEITRHVGGTRQPKFIITVLMVGELATVILLSLAASQISTALAERFSAT